MLSLTVPGCNECERSACEAVGRRGSSSQISRGLVGVVALESDAAQGGCFECRFSTTELSVWATPNRVSDLETARAVVSGGPAAIVFTAEGRYERPLEVGHYLVCASLGKGMSRPCAAVSISASGLVTVNVKQVFGPSSLVVFEPGSDAPRTEHTFALASDGCLTGQLRLSPTSWESGSVAVGQSDRGTFQVTNVGCGLSGHPTVAVTGDGFFLHRQECAHPLGVQESCAVEVRFEPRVAGKQGGQLVVSATPGGAVMGRLEGTALPPITDASADGPGTDGADAGPTDAP